MAARIHLADIGTLLACAFKEPNGSVFDISAATTKQISFQRPAGTSFTRNGSFATDGTDGLLNYTTIAGDFDVDGYWYLQGHVIFPDGDEFHSDRVRIRIWPNNAS